MRIVVELGIAVEYLGGHGALDTTGHGAHQLLELALLGWAELQKAQRRPFRPSMRRNILKSAAEYDHEARARRARAKRAERPWC